MRELLQGQKALVTGASSGIGAAVARGLAAAGAAVAVNYRSQRGPADQVVEEIRAAGGEAIAVAADVAQEDQVAAMVAQAVAAFGTLDIMVANAGLQKDHAFATMSLADWRSVIDVNLSGQFLCCREAVRRFTSREPRPEVSRARGKIICMSSVHEIIPWAGHVNYAASKGGLHMMMQSLAQEVAGLGIRVNAVAPGAVRTPINKEAWETPQALERLLRLIPYGRIGEPEDVAKAVVWLASDEADYVTGTTLFVDGGMTLYPGFRDGG